MKTKEEINETLAALKDAAEAGEVIVPHLETGALKLGQDSDCTFSISKWEGAEGVFCLTLADGGGFTGFLMGKDEWAGIRAKIDAFIEADGKLV